MLPLASYRHPDDPVLLLAHRDVTAAAFFSQIQRLAAALPLRACVINLCEARHAFMLGFAAALVRGQTTLLPPGRGRSDWELTQARYPNAYLLSDQPVDAPAVFDVTPFLADGAVEPLRIPAIDGAQVAAILFTSGSTGQPTEHAKTWRQLWRGAAHLAAALGWPERPTAAVVGSVPPQHMFGLESTVMLPWRTGVPVHGAKPLLAADLESALAGCARPAWWMTTPTHLHAPLRASARLAPLQGVLASTMSLPAPLAAAAEAAWQAPVLEIYGSTETGALAIRRTAEQPLWTPLADVSLRSEGQGEAQRIHASGTHIEVPVRLDDRLEFQPDGRFLWVGRATDLVKIGGKRTSLSALNQALLGIDGIDDGVYLAPDDAPDPAASQVQRLAAFYVSATLAEPAVLAALRARLDPVFLPRPLCRVERLPRNANGKLPRAALAALLRQCRGQVSAVLEDAAARMHPFMIPSGHPALPGHFPGDPIVPGALILSHVAQAIAQDFPETALGVLQAARFQRPLRPDQACLVALRRRAGRVSFEVRLTGATDEALIASGHWACPPPGEATMP